MKDFFKPARTDKIIYRMSAASLILILFTFAYVFIRFFSLPPFVPVFNQLPWGNQRVGETFTIFIPLLLAFLILIFNISLSSFIYSKNPLLSRILSVTSLLVILLVLIFSIVITSLII